MINRSQTWDTPRDPVAIDTACLFGTRVAEAILAAVIATAQKAGHMIASDLIGPTSAPNQILPARGRPHMGPLPPLARRG